MTKNNGIRGYIIDDEKYTNDGNTLSFAQDTFSVFYQRQRYFTGNKVKVLKAKFEVRNEGIMQYLAGSFQKSLLNFSWGIGSTINTISQIKIQLPTKNGEIDFNFMESFIAELEAERIAELEAYLLATGLKDYTLTQQEQQVLADFESNNVEWDEYMVRDLFEIKGNPQLNKDSFVFDENGEYPYFTRTTLGNGFAGYVNYLDEKHKISGGCLAIGMIGMQFFYMEKDFYAGQFTKSATPKYFCLSQKIAKYLISLLNKNKQVFQNVLVRDFENQFNKIKIQLPSKNNQPNYEVMETFISAIQKLVIKDVVIYADRKIEATKTIVNK